MTFLELARQRRLRHGFATLGEGGKVIDAQLDVAEKGALHGPFSDGKQIAAYVKAFQAQRAGKSKTKKR